MAPENSKDSHAMDQDVQPPPSKLLPKEAKKKKEEKKDEDLSEEDLALKQQLELYVERVQDGDPAIQKMALEAMRQEIRTATSSMTSVPKPLKFLRPHYGTLKSYYEKMVDSELKRYLADVISVLALTMSEDGDRVSCPYQVPFLFACLASAQTVSPILSSGQDLTIADIVSLFHLNTLTKSMCLH
jgi:26S proteasome regulatory subunit N1